MSTEIKTYRDLEVWNRAIGLAVTAYKVAGLLPTSELYVLSAQLRRCATSVPANVAEGHEMKGKSYLRHVKIALGSVAELETHVEVALRVGLLKAEDVNVLLNQAVQVGQMLNGLRRGIARKIARQASSR